MVHSFSLFRERIHPCPHLICVHTSSVSLPPSLQEALKRAMAENPELAKEFESTLAARVSVKKALIRPNVDLLNFKIVQQFLPNFTDA